MLGDLFQGALWLALIGLVAIVVVIALVVAAVRRGANRVGNTLHDDDADRYRGDDYRSLSGVSTPHSEEIGRYEGGDVRTTTETGAGASTDPIYGDRVDRDERNG